MQERRVHPRFRVHVDVHYRSTVVQASAPLVDISVGGVFVETTVPLPVGTQIVLHPVVDSDDGLQLAELRGKVVRAVEHGLEEAGETPAGMGVEFEPLGSRQREQILALIDRRSSEGSEASAAEGDPDATVDDSQQPLDHPPVSAAGPESVPEPAYSGTPTIKMAAMTGLGEPAPSDAASESLDGTDSVDGTDGEDDAKPKKRSRRRKGRRRKKDDDG